MATRKRIAPERTMVVYSVAISMDGFIADKDGGVDWLNASMVKGEGYGLMEFMNSIDGMLMGSRTYEVALQMGGGMGASKPSWVFSSRDLPGGKGVTVTPAAPREVVGSLANHGIRRAWLMGGGNLASSFLADGLIDEVSVAVMPVILGSGVPVFSQLPALAKMKLLDVKTYKGGALGLRYEPVRRSSVRGQTHS